MAASTPTALTLDGPSAVTIDLPAGVELVGLTIATDGISSVMMERDGTTAVDLDSPGLHGITMED